MANGHGGARTPSNPAPVSGPGALSRRTDGAQPIRSLPDAGYGEQAEFRGLQQSVPLPRAGAPSAGGAGGTGANPLASIVGLDAASTMPDTPVTDGAELGAGAGLDALGLPQTPEQEEAMDAKALPAGMVQAMIAHSMTDQATPSFKRMLRVILAARA